jgi:Ca-activated chloride channel homolog
MATQLTFAWPSMLWLQLLVPAVMLGYWLLLARRRHGAESYPGLQTVGIDGTPTMRATTSGQLRTAAPALLLLAGLIGLLLAVARPHAALTLPARIDTVVLALDISGSMRATDLEPTRLAAAQSAARAFVAEQPSGVRIGVVAIAASAAVVQSPTNDRNEVMRAIDRLETQRGTALGSGLVIALDSALPDAKVDVEGFINPQTKTSAVERIPRPAGELAGRDPRVIHGSAAIVLLSDGQSNVGPEPAKAAELAAQHGVRIYTVGIGKPEGTTVNVDGWSMRVRLDEDTLKRVASITQAEYFRAADASQLKKIYNALSMQIGFEKQRPVEITALVAALGALLATLGAAFSMLWFNRIL